MLYPIELLVRVLLIRTVILGTRSVAVNLPRLFFMERDGTEWGVATEVGMRGQVGEEWPGSSAAKTPATRPIPCLLP